MASFALFNSLKFRLVLSAGLMILLVLPVIGYTISNAFEQKLTQAIKRELSAYSYAILAVTEVDNNQLLMPEQLLENQFNVSQSGLYATITQSTTQATLPKNNLADDDVIKSHTLWQSQSLLSMTNIQGLVTPDVGNTNFSYLQIADFLPAGNNHFVYSFTVVFSTQVNNISQDFPLTIHIIKSVSDFETLLSQFKQQLWTWLLVLMILLIVVQVFWLVWTLKPLRELKQELQGIEQGKLARLQKKYPIELTQVTHQLNLLLDTEQKQRERYRNSLADLAHSLKTPLAVIQSQGELPENAQQQLTTINQIIEHQLKRAQIAGESSWHIGVSVDEVLNKLLNSLAKIYHEKDLAFIKHCDDKNHEKSIFKGDEADLLELLGNLLDNACKAAKKSVLVDVESSSGELSITVADDGAGISDALQEQILKRGIRADTYQQGHGIGLAIVRDLVSSYKGEISVGHSTKLGGAEFTLLFKL